MKTPPCYSNHARPVFRRKTRIVRRAFLFLSGAILMLCDPATAQTVVESTWVNPATQGYWGNAASWSPAAVPNNTGGTVYDVRVNVAAAKFAEQNTPNVTIRSLHKEGAGTLLLHERIRVENGGAFHEGVINLLGTNGRLEIYGGVFDWTGGTIQGLRHLHVSGDGFSVLRIAPATSVEMNAEIRNYGTVLWEAGDVTSIDFENILNYGIFHIRTDGQITRPVINQNGDGKILKSGPSDATLHASTGGHGSLEVVAGSLTLANGGGFSGPVRLGFRDLPVIVSPLAANATPGTEFSYQIETGAQVWVYGASGLPAGLSVNTETGLISGTIAESVNPGVYEVGLMVSDYNSTDAAKLLITVEENNPFVITSELWIAQEWNSYFNYEITTSQPANIRQAIGHEMAGLTFHGPSGTLSGTLQSPGVYFIDLFASNGAQSDFKTLELHVYFPGDPPPQPFSENELEVFANSPQMAPSSIPAARLVLGGNSTFQKFSGTGEFTLEADAELEVLPNATANIQHAGDLSGAILVRGTGALTMAGGTYSGVVEIEPTGSLAFTGAPNFSAGAGFRVDGTLDASALTNSWTMPTESQVLGGGTIQGNFVSTGQVGGGTAEDTLTIQGNAVLDGATLLVKTGASEDFVNSRIDVAGILNLTDANLEIEGDLETRTVIIANCETLEPGFSLSGLPDEYQVESLQDDDDGFNVALVPSDYLVWIVSHPSVPAHLRGRDDDADGDGVSNEQEFIDGTDPSNPDSFLPTIITQPQSIAVPGGGTGGQATLTVVANVGATPSYQWYYGETGDESNPVENANTASLTVGRVTAETNFWVKVSNVSDATHSVDSDTATISLVPGYFQDFDDLGAGIPIDWQVRTGATASSLGTPSTTYFPENGTWNASQGGFKSLASLTIDDDDAAPFDQHAWPDRALGIRQTADFGDPGAAFTFRLPDTIGKYDFHLSVDLMMLSVQSRSTTWSVEVGFGEAPTEFDLLTTYEDPGVFGLTQLDLSLQAITNLPHRDTPVWFRIVALNPSTGGGSRDTFAIDNFSLTWLETEPPTDLHLTNQSILENEPVGTVVGAFTSSSPITTEGFVYSLVPGVGNDDNANFSIVGSQLRTALDFDFETQTSHSIRVRTTQPDGGWLEKVFVITILSAAETHTLSASLNGSYSVPPVASPGHGEVTMTLDQNTNQFTLTGTFSDLVGSTTAAHVHGPAGAGTSAGILFGITITPGATSGTMSFEGLISEANAQHILDGNTYINVHTTAFPGGEIRGQILVVGSPPQAPTNIALSNNSVFENQPIDTVVGTLSASDPDYGDTHTFTLVEENGDTDNVGFTIDGDQLLTAASFNFETKNSYNIRVRTTDSRGLFFEKEFVISIISATHNLSAFLSGSYSVPPVASPGHGEATMTLNQDTNQFTLTGTFSDLVGSTTAAHVHGPAGAGTSAGILFGITITPGATSGTMSFEGLISEANAQHILDGNTYINVHTTAFPGGEIRGQILVVTPPPAPVVATGAAINITSTGVTLNGTVNPNGAATIAYFEYGLTTSYGYTADAELSPDNGTTAQNVIAPISGLSPATLYYYRVTATNAGGTRQIVGTFTTMPPLIDPAELVAPEIKMVDGNVEFTVVHSVAGRRYQLQQSDTLQPGSWSNVEVERLGDGGPLVIAIPRAPELTRRFYRLALDPMAP